MSEEKSDEYLKYIADLIEERLPKPEPWWRFALRKISIPITILFSLFFVEFPTEARKRADVVAFDGSEIRLAKLKEPNWKKILGIDMNPNFWKVGELPDNVGVLSIYTLNLVRGGRVYKSSAIRVLKHEGENQADLLSPPVSIKGPTELRLEPFAKDGDHKLLSDSVIRTHGLIIDDTIIPLTQVIKNGLEGGFVVVEIRPRRGWERFYSNLERAFSVIN